MEEKDSSNIPDMRLTFQDSEETQSEKDTDMSPRKSTLSSKLSARMIQSKLYSPEKLQKSPSEKQSLTQREPAINYKQGKICAAGETGLAVNVTQGLQSDYQKHRVPKQGSKSPSVEELRLKYSRTVHTGTSPTRRSLIDKDYSTNAGEAAQAVSSSADRTVHPKGLSHKRDILKVSTVDDKRKTVSKKQKHRKKSHTEKSEQLHHDPGRSPVDESDSEIEPQYVGDEVTFFENSLGKIYQLDLSDEVKTLVQELAEQAKTAKPPTPAKLKIFPKVTLELLLKFNDRPAYNLEKQQLAAMVCDFMKNGVPPRCPKCKKGALKFSNGKKKYGKRFYWCPGHTPDGRHFYGCGFKSPREEIERIPWKCP